MATIYAQLNNEAGKIKGLSAKEYLDIDIRVKNAMLGSFTVRRGEIPDADGQEGWILYDNNDDALWWIADNNL